MPLELYGLVSSGLALFNTFARPRRAITTKRLRFANCTGQALEAMLTYYTVDVDNRWSWPKLRLRFAADHTTPRTVYDRFGFPVHAAKFSLVYRFPDRMAGDEWTAPPDDQVIVAEAYYARERASHDVYIHSDPRLYGIGNETDKTLNVRIRYRKWHQEDWQETTYQLPPHAMWRDLVDDGQRILGQEFEVSASAADGTTWPAKTFMETEDGPHVDCWTTLQNRWLYFDMLGHRIWLFEREEKTETVEEPFEFGIGTSGY
jgi:hypothetical protein